MLVSTVIGQLLYCQREYTLTPLWLEYGNSMWHSPFSNI